MSYPVEAVAKAYRRAQDREELKRGLIIDLTLALFFTVSIFVSKHLLKKTLSEG